MKMKTPKANLTTYFAAASLLMVFVIDVITPSHIAIDILYLCCILILFKQNTTTIISFSIVACLLILVNAVFEHMDDFELAVWLNRLISISAIFITSYIAVHYRKASKQGAVKEEQYLRSLEEMLFITSHQVRKPVANILGLADLINTEHEHVSSDDLKEHCRLLQHSAAELDDFIKELSKAIREAEEKHRISE
jgi:signal transduction histidine kinase